MSSRRELILDKNKCKLNSNVGLNILTSAMTFEWWHLAHTAFRINKGRCHVNVNSFPISIQDKTTTNKKEPPLGKLKISATVRKMRRSLSHAVKLESSRPLRCRSRGWKSLFTFPSDYNLNEIT